jgi:hypothetical protein
MFQSTDCCVPDRIGTLRKIDVARKCLEDVPEFHEARLNSLFANGIIHCVSLSRDARGASNFDESVIIAATHSAVENPALQTPLDTGTVLRASSEACMDFRSRTNVNTAILASFLYYAL